MGYYRVDYEGGLLNAPVKGDVDRRLSAAERLDFMGNAEALADAGKLPEGEALGLAGIFHADPAWQVVEGAMALAGAPREHLVPENLEANYQRFVLKNFQARARELGWIEKAGESDDVRLLRPHLLRMVATLGDDQTLAKQARELTDKWFSDPRAIQPDMLGSVLDTAAYYGDKNLLERFLAQYKKTQDRQERQRILQRDGLLPGSGRD